MQGSKPCALPLGDAPIEVRRSPLNATPSYLPLRPAAQVPARGCSQSINYLSVVVEERNPAFPICNTVCWVSPSLAVTQPTGYGLDFYDDLAQLRTPPSVSSMDHLESSAGVSPALPNDECGKSGDPTSVPGRLLFHHSSLIAGCRAVKGRAIHAAGDEGREARRHPRVSGTRLRRCRKGAEHTGTGSGEPRPTNGGEPIQGR